MTEKGQQDGSRQRIDKWLFFARVVKSRSLAQSLIAAGAVTLNGGACNQPSRTIKAGDRIELLLDRRDIVLVVRAAGDRRGPFEEARSLYDDLTPPPDEQRRLTPFERSQRGLGAGGSGKGER
ncbi:RNA-binding S4 domain-containing protein [Rhizobium puerariae]|uniref:RNA-binding S4 domain-containing protein n=1 Tax=Rhizobium puerariae TaxID=1585791 RepID=A0ABV6AGI8_9HYPH